MADTGTRDAICVGCGQPWAGALCQYCGFVPSLEVPSVPWPDVGTQVECAEFGLTLRVPIQSSPTRRRYLAEDHDGGRYEVLFTGDPELIETRIETTKCLGARGLPPCGRGEHDGLAFIVSPLDGLRAMVDLLAAAIADRERNDAIELVESWVHPIASCFAELHGRGLSILGADPAEVFLDGAGNCRFRDIPVPQALDGGTVGPQARRLAMGFSAPELYGRCGGRVGPTADVFFVGCFLYYVLARIAPMAEAGLSSHRLPPPNIFHPHVPPELSAVAHRAISPIPGRRYPDPAALLAALERATASARTRRQFGYRPITIDVGHELHIGILKGQYAPVNQDDLFLAYHQDSAIGLFLVTDGVSLSQFGTGDMASGCVRHEATNTWRALLDTEAAGAVDETVDIALDTLDGLDSLGLSLPPSHEARCRMLTQMLDAANVRIGVMVREEVPDFPGQPEGIMAATAIATLLDKNRATMAFIGDSRIYLIRDGHLARLTMDHNLTTQLIRQGRQPTFARNFTGGNALIRCVGEFEKTPMGDIVAVPLRPEFIEIMLMPGDTVLMCSDGIPDYAGMDEEDAERLMLEIVESAPGAPWAAFELMVQANRGGGGDNISCIVMRVLGQTPHQEDET